MGESPWFLENAARPRLLRCSNAVPVKGRLAAKDESEGKDVKPVIDRTRSVSSEETQDKGRGGVVERSSTASRDPVAFSDGVASSGTEPPAESSGPVQDTIAGKPLNDTPTDDPSSSIAEKETAPPTLNGVDQISTPTIPRLTPDAEPDTQTTQTLVVAEPDPESPIPNPSLSQVSSSSQPARRARTAAAATANGARKTKLNFHVRPELLPVTRFHRDELESHWEKLLGLVLDQEMTKEDRARWLGLEDGDGELMDKVEEYIRKRKHRPTSSEFTTKDSTGDTGNSDVHASGDTPRLESEPESGPSPEVNKYYTRSTTAHDPAIKPIPDPAGLEDQTHPFMLVQADDLDNTLFDRLWSKGEPMVVNGIGERFKQSWTPDTFINRFGTEDCRKSSLVRNWRSRWLVFGFRFGFGADYDD